MTTPLNQFQMKLRIMRPTNQTQNQDNLCNIILPDGTICQRERWAPYTWCAVHMKLGPGTLFPLLFDRVQGIRKQNTPYPLLDVFQYNNKPDTKQHLFALKFCGYFDQRMIKNGTWRCAFKTMLQQAANLHYQSYSDESWTDTAMNSIGVLRFNGFAQDDGTVHTRDLQTILQQLQYTWHALQGISTLVVQILNKHNTSRPVCMSANRPAIASFLHAHGAVKCIDAAHSVSPLAQCFHMESR